MLQSPQKVLIYGTHANPLSLLLSRSLNLHLSASNVFCVDTESSRQQNRLHSTRDNFQSINELSDLTSQDDLHMILDQNQITDIVDLTNTSCKIETEHDKITGLPDSVRLFTPIFSTPLDILEHKASRQQKHSPVLPGIVYPFHLAKYRFPCDLGTFLFSADYSSSEVELDCIKIKV